MAFLADSSDYGTRLNVETTIRFKPISLDAARRLLVGGFRSAVGHADTAALLGAQLGLPVEVDRIHVAPPLDLVVAQYRGPRLPAGATTLPEGPQIVWWRVCHGAAAAAPRAAALSADDPPKTTQRRLTQRGIIYLAYGLVKYDGRTSTQDRYDLGSLDNRDGPALLQAARGHWGVGNPLRWSLDVTFRGDDRRVRTDHAAENFGRFRRFRRLTPGLLKREATFNAGCIRNRLRCAMTHSHLIRVTAE